MKNLINTTATKRLLINGINKLEPPDKKNSLYMYDERVSVLTSIYKLDLNDTYRITRDKL